MHMHTPRPVFHPVFDLPRRSRGHQKKDPFAFLRKGDEIGLVSLTLPRSSGSMSDLVF